jgi:hypothetical protein
MNLPSSKILPICRFVDRTMMVDSSYRIGYSFGDGKKLLFVLKPLTFPTLCFQLSASCLYNVASFTILYSASIVTNHGWVKKLFLIDDWSWFAMMVPVTFWYWMSMNWLDKNSGWAGSEDN